MGVATDELRASFDRRTLAISLTAPNSDSIRLMAFYATIIFELEMILEHSLECGYIEEVVAHSEAEAMWYQF